MPHTISLYMDSLLNFSNTYKENKNQSGLPKMSRTKTTSRRNVRGLPAGMSARSWSLPEWSSQHCSPFYERSVIPRILGGSCILSLEEWEERLIKGHVCQKPIRKLGLFFKLYFNWGAWGRMRWICWIEKWICYFLGVKLHNCEGLSASCSY